MVYYMNQKDFGVETDLSIFTDTMVEMTWQEVEQASKNGDIILLPIGIVEEHGLHLDLSPDIYMAYIFSTQVPEALPRLLLRHG